MRRTKIMLALGACAMLASGAAVAAAPKQVGANGKWAVFIDEEGGKVCFIAARPDAQSPKSLNWEPQFYVMRGAVTEGRDEPSVNAGYQYQDGSQATVSIGTDTFTLFTDEDGAWIADVEEEKKLVEAMKAGATMIVKGVSARGNTTTDTYSLSGVTAGLKEIQSSCP